MKRNAIAERRGSVARVLASAGVEEREGARSLTVAPPYFAPLYFALLLAALSVWCPRAGALNAGLDVSQYAHTAWKIRDGFARGTILAITQTPDGYLLLGTENGLLRFDGVNAVRWEPPGGQLPSNFIINLLTTRDGTIWIGTRKGLASWKDGKLTRYPGFGEQLGIRPLLEDREGTVWVSEPAVSPPGKLCAIRNGSVQCYTEGGAFDYGPRTLLEDSKGNLWVGVTGGLWRWKPGPPKFFSFLGETLGIRAICEDTDGELLVGSKGGLWRFKDGKAEAYSSLHSLQPFRTQSLFQDRDGGLWMATLDKGLVHIHQGRVDTFSQPDGLSGNAAQNFFEDREGNVWVATTDGLDRFREFAVSTFGAKQGLPTPFVTSVLADRDGSVWLVTTGGSLYRSKNGQINTYDKRDGKMNGASPMSLFQDARGKVWVSTYEKPGGVGHLENNHFVLSDIGAKTIFSYAEDKAGNLWMADQNTGLFRLSAQNQIQQIPWQELGHKDPALPLAVDPLQDGLWIGFFQGGVIYYADGRVQKSYSAADGLGKGRVANLRFGSRGSLWAATEGGLSRIRDGRIMTLTSKNGLPCDTAHWSLEDDEHFVWLGMPCGLVRFARSDLDSWVAAVEKDQKAVPTVKATVFDISDGMRSRASVGGYGPFAAKSKDGKLWISGYDGVSVVDPKHLPFNKIPPPVHIEQVIADHKKYEVPARATGQGAIAEERGNALPDGRATVDDRATVGASGSLPLPAQTRDLEIDYTALSLVAAEKVQFAYKLEGFDSDWQDAGNRRQAFYTNLPPKKYTFRVKACNNSGVWNEAGTALNFSVAPAYYQALWFQSLCVLALAGIVWAIYNVRVRHVAALYKGRMEERLQERERIARDLHDTFLQSVQGLVLKFDAVSRQIPSEQPARKAMENALDLADVVLAEGRSRVRNLRDGTELLSDLPAAFRRVAEESPENHQSEFKAVVEGNARELHPMVLEETYCIGREALMNALSHSGGLHIEAEITYDARQFRLRIRDDGRGIDAAILEQGGKTGHWGLQGMRERAQRIGGQLEFWSRVGTGTEVELRVPGTTAYRSSGTPPKRKWLERAFEREEKTS